MTEVVIAVAGLPPAKNGPSLLSTSHPHHQRVIALLRAVAEQLPDGFVPFREAVSLTLILRSPADAPRGDPTNFLGGVADVLQRKADVESLGELAEVLVYENDLQLRRIDFRQDVSPFVEYELKIVSLGGPDLVGRRPRPIPGIELVIELGEVDEIALGFVNAIEHPGRRDLKIHDVSALLAWLQLQRVVPDPILREVHGRLEESAADAQAQFTLASNLSAALARLLVGQREPNDVALLTELRRAGARHETIDLDADHDLALASLQLDGSDPMSVLIPIVRSALRLLLPSVRDRVRVCAAETCGKLLLDRTKNGTKIWCSMESCGNRVKQRAYRERRMGLAEDVVTYVVT